MLKNLKIKLSIVFALFFFIWSCSTSDKEESIKTDNKYPNKSSELALLMRAMKEKTFELKDLVENNGTINADFIAEFEKIHQAIPTDSTIKGPEFDTMASDYLVKLKSFAHSDTNRVENFNNMITSCMNCHQSLCPGPTVVIKKMFINI